MAYFDGTKVVTIATTPYPGCPGWERIDCGCCSGLEWGGEEPRECKWCAGTGFYARHIETGTIAEYPGGRLLGAREGGGK